MIVLLRVILLSFVFMIAVAPSANAEKRIALVIGNSNYVNLTPLTDPSTVDDAHDVAEALASLGFSPVLKGENLNHQDMWDKIDEFVNAIKPGDTALFYYSGHGAFLSASDSNLTGNHYLPVDVPDSKSTRETSMARRSVSEAEVINSIKRKALVEVEGRGNVILIVDACRNVPVFGKSAGSQEGLGRPSGSGIIALYAAGSGQIAFDKFRPEHKHRNSVYTRELLPLLKEKGLKMSEIGSRVAARVSKLAIQEGRRQTPAMYFEGASDVLLTGPVQDGYDEQKDLLLWLAVKDSNRIETLRNYLSQFSDGKFVDEVNARITALEEREPEALRWTGIKNSRDPNVFIQFLSEFPGGAHAADAKNRHEETLWAQADNSGNETLLKRYVEAFPDGRFVVLATRQLDDPGPAVVPPDDEPDPPPDVCREAELGRYALRQQPAKFMELYYADLNSGDSYCAIRRWSTMTDKRRSAIANFGGAEVSGTTIQSQDGRSATVQASGRVRIKSGPWEDFDVIVKLDRLDSRWAIANIKERQTLTHRIPECPDSDLSPYRWDQQPLKLVEIYYSDLDQRRTRCAKSRWRSLRRQREKQIANFGGGVQVNHARLLWQNGSGARVEAYVRMNESGVWKPYKVHVDVVQSDGTWKISDIGSAK